jgi:hypothetical protein
MSKSRPVQGQGSSHFLKMPSDIFEAKGEVDSGIPLEGGIEPSDPTKRSRDPYDNSLSLLARRVLLTLTAHALARVAQITFGTIQESRVRLMPHP